MKNFVRTAIATFVVASVLTPLAPAAELVIDGTFTGVVNQGTNTYTFGQFGTGTGSVLTFKDWSTSGYNFVYAPGTADSGTNANGANAGQPHEAPGQYNGADKYGNTYLFGKNNGGLSDITACPAGGNFIAADGAFQTKAITQTINGLTVGSLYAISFWWAGAQQEGSTFTSATTESWQISLGADSNTTDPVSIVNKGFSGWQQQVYVYRATSTSEVLSFLAAGTPTGQPPFSLLGGVSMSLVPEPATWTYLVGLAAAGVFVGVGRRRRRQKLVSQVD